MSKSKGCGCLPLIILLGSAGYGGYYLYEQYLQGDSTVETGSSISNATESQKEYQSDAVKEAQDSATADIAQNKKKETTDAEEEALLKEQEAARLAQEEALLKAREETRLALEEARKAREYAQQAQEEADKAKEELEKYAQASVSSENEASTEQTLPEEHGLSASQIRELGVDYAEARNGKQQDEQRAIQLYVKAAEMGDIKAQRWMGWRYRQGRGVQQNEELAYSYFLAAANQGDEDAAKAINLTPATHDETYGLSAAQIRELGVDYAEARNGKRKDEQRAIQLYIKAADMGDIKAQRWMGWRYRQGHGVQKNEQWARAYFSAAASQGDKAAAEALRQ